MPHPVPKEQTLALFPFQASQEDMDELISEYLANKEENITKFAPKETFPENMLVATQASISCPEELSQAIFSQLSQSMSPDEGLSLGRKRKDFPADVLLANDLRRFQPGNSGPLSQHKHNNYLECRRNYGFESSQPGYFKTATLPKKRTEAGFLELQDELLDDSILDDSMMAELQQEQEVMAEDANEPAESGRESASDIAVDPGV